MQLLDRCLYGIANISLVIHIIFYYSFPVLVYSYKSRPEMKAVIKGSMHLVLIALEFRCSHFVLCSLILLFFMVFSSFYES